MDRFAACSTLQNQMALPVYVPARGSDLEDRIARLTTIDTPRP